MGLCHDKLLIKHVNHVSWTLVNIVNMTLDWHLNVTDVLELGYLG